jgi:hypothetical protein
LKRIAALEPRDGIGRDLCGRREVANTKAQGRPCHPALRRAHRNGVTKSLRDFIHEAIVTQF